VKNKISLGTANFTQRYGLNRDGLKLSINEINKILNFSIKHKINNLDTAVAYAGVEKKLGKFNLKDFKISSKLRPISKNTHNIEKKIFSEIHSSLNKLRVKRLEILFLHNANDLIDEKKNLKIYETFKKAKKLNLIKKIGISVYSVKELIKIIEKFKIDAVQLPYSLLDRRFEKVYPLLKKKNIYIQVRSIFLQGVLLQKIENLPKYFLKFKEIEKLEKWIKKNKISKLETSINFIKQSNFINSYVIGFNNLEQLAQIIKCFKKKQKLFPKKIFSNNLNLIDPRRWKINLK